MTVTRFPERLLCGEDGRGEHKRLRLHLEVEAEAAAVLTAVAPRLPFAQGSQHLAETSTSMSGLAVALSRQDSRKAPGAHALRHVHDDAEHSDDRGCREPLPCLPSLARFLSPSRSGAWVLVLVLLSAVVWVALPWPLASPFALLNHSKNNGSVAVVGDAGGALVGHHHGASGARRRAPHAGGRRRSAADDGGAADASHVEGTRPAPNPARCSLCVV